jgi:ligand-binding sensor domain-containing protein
MNRLYQFLCIGARISLVMPLSVALSGSSPSEKNDYPEAGDMPVYGNWQTFTTKNGLPDDKAYCVRIDGDRVLVGTKAGLAVYENNQWRTYTVEDGLAHPGILSIDVSELTGDVWLGTLGGLNRWSAGRFETFTQFNSGLANDVIYSVICDGKDVWVATGGGAGHYDTYTDTWGIYTERNAPMHEPWTYGVCAGDDKIFIAAWGGGVIEYNKKTGKFRDYVDPDGEMELDVFPDDGVVHDITTGVSHADGILWVATYFGLSRYDGVHWKGYFDHDSGLLSNFINFLKADGPVVYICTDLGLSSFDGDTWVSYHIKDNSHDGEILITNGKVTKKMDEPTSISHNFVIGVDTQDDEIWISTSKGVSRGERLN